MPHIDFIFGDHRWKPKDDNPIMHILQLQYPKVQSCFQEDSNNQKKQSCKRKRSNPASKHFEEYEDQQENQKFMRLIFNPRGHLLNSRSSSLEDGDN